VTDLLLFDPTVLSVQQGETVTFRIHNAGQAIHEFKVGPMQEVFETCRARQKWRTSPRAPRRN